MLERAQPTLPSWPLPLATAVAAVGLGLLIGALAAVGSPLLASAALLGGTLLLLILRAPVVGLYALVPLAYLLPFAVIPVRLGIQATVLDALLGVTLGAVLLRALARHAQPHLRRPELLLAAVIGLGAFSFLLSLPYTGDTLDVGRRVLKLVLAMLTLPLTLRLVRGERAVERLVRLLILCGALEGLIAVALVRLPRETMVRLLSVLGPLGYPTGESVLRFLPGENDTYTDVLRATGTSIDPNVLGGVLLLAAGLQLVQLFAPRPLLPRMLLLLCTVPTVLGMLLSHSRSSWVGLALALLALATLRYRRLWLLIGLATLAVAATPVGRALYGRVLSGFAAQDKAASMRLDEYRNALEIIQQYPLFGIGFGAPPSIDLAPGVSSLYLTVAETMGLPALALYLILVGGVLLRALRALLHCADGRRQGVLAALSTALIGALITGLLDHYFASTAFPHMVALFWLLWGLLWISAEEAGDTERADRPMRSAPVPSVSLWSDP